MSESNPLHHLEYLWTSEIGDYVLQETSASGTYLIINTVKDRVLILEDDEEYRLVVAKMIEAGNRILKYGEET
jgi:hypothetical protein